MKVSLKNQFQFQSYHFQKPLSTQPNPLPFSTQSSKKINIFSTSIQRNQMKIAL